MGKLENLKSATWINAQPSIVAVNTAYGLSHADNHFYMVTWWGDEPAGFTRFEFTGLVSGGYEIMITEERAQDITALESDEWVLVFTQ